jgi:hypothetical protein
MQFAQYQTEIVLSLLALWGAYKVYGNRSWITSFWPSAGKKSSAPTRDDAEEAVKLLRAYFKDSPKDVEVCKELWNSLWEAPGA